jgi:hypothetical protein
MRVPSSLRLRKGYVQLYALSGIVALVYLRAPVQSTHKPMLSMRYKETKAHPTPGKPAVYSIKQWTSVA